MRLIQRQGLKYSIVNFAGLMLGAISTFFVYPLVKEELGLIRFLLDTSALLFPLISLGVNSLSVRYFPYFEDKATVNHGFLGILLSLALGGTILFGLIMAPFWPNIYAYYAAKDVLYRDYLWLLPPLTLLTLFNTIFNQYSANFKRIVIPSILFDISQKLVLPLLLIAYLLKWVSLTMVIYGIVVHAILVAVGFCWYLRHLGALGLRPDWKFIDPTLRKEMIRYAAFGVVAGTGFLTILKIDGWVVGTFMGTRENGIYSIAAFIASVMQIPMRAIATIAMPLVSKHWFDNNFKELDVLYRKASLNILLPGLLLFGAFVVSIDPFFQVIPKGETLISGRSVILLLGVSRLIDMATGLNNQLLSYSKEYKFSLMSIVVLAVATLVFNWLFVPRYGLAGAALATLISTSLYNISSVLVIWYKYRLQPFTRQTLYVLGLAGLSYLLVWMLPPVVNPYVSIVVKSGLFCLLYGGAVVWLRISEDLNDLLEKLMEKLPGKRAV